MDLWVTERHQDQIGYTYKVKETLYHATSAFQTIDIVDTEFYGRMLLLDGKTMTTECDEFIYHELITHIPMLAHSDPRKILVIGGGDGGTIREILKHPHVEQVILCEIDNLVVEASKQFLPTIACALGDPRVNIQIRDGIEYISSFKKAFDVILIDSTDPIGPGEGLFTEAFYQDVLNALKPNGIMVSQSESPWAMQLQVRKQYDLLKKVFPIVKPYVATVPTYPGGYWSWSFCSNHIQPLDQINEPIARQLQIACRFYNLEMHRAVFALPNFIKELIGEAVSVHQ